MKSMLITSALLLGLGLAATSHAAAPAGSTGECKDGTYTDAAKKGGACSGHGGVKDWYSAAKPDKTAAKPDKSSAATSTGTAAKPVVTAPSGSTALCKDGTHSDSMKKSGACSGHGGVKDGYGAGKAATEKPTATSAGAAAPSTTTGARDNAKPTATASPMSPRAAVGEPGQVWINTDSKVYHCSGDRWYGKTKQGQYASESQAKAMGANPSDGKPCG